MSDPIPNAPTVPPPADDVASLDPIPRARIEVTLEGLTKLLTTVTTNAWKVRGRVRLEPKNEELREELKKDDIKKIARHLDSIFDALTEFGVEIRDRTGEPYDYGLPDKIVSSMPRPGLSKELIIETLKPTIYWRSHIAQAGEVVIAVPAAAEETKTEKI